MSIAKDINVNGKSFNDSRSLYEYIMDALKTDNGKYIDGLGFVTNDYLGEFQAVKVSNQKTAGRQFRQITISITPVGNDLSNDDYLEIGRRIAKYYYDKGYQVIISLHLDTDTRHLHLMVNSVNYRNGKKFSQSKSDLNRLKLHCNHILADYGLDQIRQSDDSMLEAVAHDLSEGFDCLELFDEIMADKASALADLCDDPSESMPIVKSTTSGQSSGYIPYSYYFSANDPARNSYLKKSYKNDQEVKYMNNTKNNQELPAVSVEHLPSVDSTTPGLYVEFAKEVNMTVPKSWNSQQVAEFVNDVNSVPAQERAFDAKIGDALFTDMKSHGIDAPVGVRSLVKLNLSFDDVMESNIIDIPYSEE